MVDITYRGVRRVSICGCMLRACQLERSAVREPWQAATPPSAQGP
jgi:hypothetical protein